MDKFSYLVGYDSNGRMVSVEEYNPTIEEMLVEDVEIQLQLFLNYRNNVSFHKFLNTSLRKFIEKFPQYEFLYQELDFNTIGNDTFLDILKEANKLGYKYYFYAINKIIKVFSIFKIEGNKIDKIKVLSLDPTHDDLLLFTVISNLFTSFINSHFISKLSWSEKNTSIKNKIYQELIKKYLGHRREIDGIIYYRINIEVN